MSASQGLFPSSPHHPPYTIHLFSQLLQARCPSHFTRLPSALSYIPNPKVISNLHCKYTDFKPNNRGVYLKSHWAICSQSLTLLALLSVLIIQSVCQSACLYFLQMWGLLTLIFVTLSAQALSQPFCKHFRMNLQLSVIQSIPFQAEEL